MLSTLAPLLVVSGVLFIALAAGVWIALSILATAWVGIELFTSAPSQKVVPTAIWGAVANWHLTALPMFIWMGEILFRTRIAEQLFQALAPLVVRLPGRLLHVNVMGCALFAAVSGSSAATAATIGRFTLPELLGRGYATKAAVGSLAASGTLGMLIPPSIVMIVYGVAADISIAQLFIAGLLPGVILASMFSFYIMIQSVWSPTPSGTNSAGRSRWRERISSMGDLLPMTILIVIVIGSMYLGVATPTEAAGIGVLGALGIAAWSRSLNVKTFTDSVLSALSTSTMIIFIVAAASVLATMMGLTGVPLALGGIVKDAGLSGPVLIVVLTLVFIILGCFLDGVSIVLLTTATLMPAIVAANIDPIWFGVYLVVVVEMSQITPPVGFNLFVVQGLTGIDIFKVAMAALPYFGLMAALVLLLLLFPEIATYLPSKMLG